MDEAVRVLGQITSSQPKSILVSPVGAPLAQTAQVTDITLPELLDTASRLEQGRRRFSRSRIVARSAIFTALGLALLLDVLKLLHVFNGPMMPSLFLMSMGLNYPLLLLMRWPQGFAQKQQETALALEAHSTDARTLGPLIDALAVTGQPERPRLLDALSPRLWTHTLEEALYLGERYRETLRNQLARHLATRQRREISDEEADFAIAVMKALATIGDEASVKTLNTVVIATPEQASINPCSVIVQDAARECLELLYARITERNKTIAEIVAYFQADVDPVFMDITLDSLGAAKAQEVLIRLLPRSKPRWKRWWPYASGPSRIQDVVALRLCRYPDKQLLGVLIDYAQNGGKPEIAIPGILERLSLLKPGDLGMLEPRHRKYLRRMLRPKFDRRWSLSPHHIVVVLDSLAVLGDREALRTVKPLLRHADSNVRETAQRLVAQFQTALAEKKAR